VAEVRFTGKERDAESGLDYFVSVRATPVEGSAKSC